MANVDKNCVLNVYEMYHRNLFANQSKKFKKNYLCLLVLEIIRKYII